MEYRIDRGQATVDLPVGHGLGRRTARAGRRELIVRDVEVQHPGQVVWGQGRTPACLGARDHETAVHADTDVAIGGPGVAIWEAADQRVRAAAAEPVE